MAKGKATLRFIGSLIWLAGICYIFWIMRVVPQGGWHDNADVLKMGDKFEAFMSIGFLGLLQSAAFARIFFSCLNSGLNTRYDNVYTDSSGREVKREMNADATMGGCFMSLILGFVLMFVASAIASPFVFCYNLYHFIDAWTRETALAGFFKLIAVLLVCASLAGTYFGGKWLYAQIDEVSRYKGSMHVRQRNSHSRIIPQTYWPQETAKNLAV